MKRTYFLSLLTAFILSSPISAQEIRLNTSAEHLDVPVFSNMKQLEELSDKIRTQRVVITD